VKLSDIVPWGRSYDEYAAMFALSASDLEKPILGCGDGPASFNVEATAVGVRVVSVDPIYQYSASEIENRVAATFATVMSQTRNEADRYLWNRFADLEALGAARLQAMRRFAADYEVGRQAGRYVVGSLPRLPFADASFGLGLCSHLLFLYSDHLSLEDHVSAVRELLRVAEEVRLFPLLTLSGSRSAHVAPLAEALRREGNVVAEVKVRYEFMRGADSMLRLSRGAPAPGEGADVVKVELPTVRRERNERKGP